MSFKKISIFSSNPNTTRGEATKLSSSKSKVVYANGKGVIIRDLDNPGLSVVYSGHVQNTAVARISPSGYYCASADASGTVRVWDTVGEEQTLKGEPHKVLSGKINDLDWDGESQRIIAVGDGREKFGHAFMVDNGASTGAISGHSKVINAVSIRQQRPFRAATAADDTLIVFHQGVPYKYDKTIKTHTKFVQDVRYAPSGDHFASVGSDGKVFIYDGKAGDTLGEFAEGHKGTATACSWSPDSKLLATSSADCTVKLWDAETRKATTTWTVGSGVNQQQVGNTWCGEQNIVSLSLSGDLNVFDPRVGNKPSRIIQGPKKAITSISASSRSGTFLAGSADGRVLSYDIASSESTLLQGSTHTNFVTAIATSPTGGMAYSAGFDDHVREIEDGGKAFTAAAVSTAAQPKSIAVNEDSTVFVAEIGRVEVIKSNQKVADLQASFNPSSVAVSGTLVAVGGEDQKVHLYDWDGKSLKESSVLEGNKGLVSALAFSQDGKYLASGDSSGKLVLFDAQKKSVVTSRWSFHSARINSLSWTADSKHCASGSLDTHVYIWSVEKPFKNIALKNAGPGGVNAVLWVDSNKLVSTGADGCARLWEIVFHA